MLRVDSPRSLRRILNLWPPFLFTGIKVMEIGEKIVYIHEGRKWWEGTKEEILHARNRELNDFVFASAMAKRAKQMTPDGE